MDASDLFIYLNHDERDNHAPVMLDHPLLV